MAAFTAKNKTGNFPKMLIFSQFPFISLLLVIFSQNAEGTRTFFRGRRHGGNLQIHSEPLEHVETPAEWFVQTLDHFDAQNTATWKQRFYRNTAYYKPGGPVFLMIGGEGEATDKWMTQGMWIEYAKTNNALCFQLEHRFYGQSRPTSDLSVESLRHLSSRQALADLATFIEAQNEQLPKGTKWVLFGGSYPGSLAAWARAKYPHLVHASMSASGPLLAIADFQDYFKVVEDALNTTSPGCVDSVATATGQLRLMLSHRVGMQTAEKMFKLCQPINPELPIDIQNLYETIAGNIAEIVQYNRDNRIGGSDKNITLDTICNIMTDKSSGAAVARLAAINSLLLSAAKEKCLDYTYSSTINQMKNESWAGTQAEGGRQWTYQTCTEFGFFQTSTRNDSQRLFGDFPLSLFEKQCTDIFGDIFSADFLEKGISSSNTEYGALNYKADRVVFVHGSIDPWHALGVTKSLGPNTPAIYIKGTAHCANMYPPSPDDPARLVEARKIISKYIGQWLRED